MNVKQAESAETKDADVKIFADKSIPVLEAHLKLITAIKKIVALGRRIFFSNPTANWVAE